MAQGNWPQSTSTGGSSSYLGSVGSTAEMNALNADAGSRCFRTDVGSGGGTYYEYTGSAWQALEGAFSGASEVEITLTNFGVWPRFWRVTVTSGDTVRVRQYDGSTWTTIATYTAAGTYDGQIDRYANETLPTKVGFTRTAGSNGSNYSVV